MSPSLYTRGSYRPALGALALLLALVTPAAYAQRLSDFPAGTRLRVRTTDDMSWREGTLEAVTRDTLALRRPDQRLAIPRENVLNVELRFEDASRLSRGINGILIGALAGVLVDGGLVAIGCAQHASECALPIVFAPVFALAGAVLGGAINASRGVETWEALPVN
jgi:hypothetical protein